MTPTYPGYTSRAGSYRRIRIAFAAGFFGDDRRGGKHVLGGPPSNPGYAHGRICRSATRICLNVSVGECRRLKIIPSVWQKIPVCFEKQERPSARPKIVILSTHMAHRCWYSADDRPTDRGPSVGAITKPRRSRRRYAYPQRGTRHFVQARVFTAEVTFTGFMG